jgi:hypothetical protein
MLFLNMVCLTVTLATSLELAQSVSVVLDPFVQGIASEWSIKRLFGKVLLSHCPLATTSRIMVEVTSNGTRLAKGKETRDSRARWPLNKEQEKVHRCKV